MVLPGTHHFKTIGFRQSTWRKSCCLCVLAVSFAIAIDSRAAARPNVVFILADDLGRHDCGFMGGTQIETPHLDQLAKAGTILDAFYVQPVCSPTRAALMTGRYPMRHGLQVGVVRPWAQYGLPLEEITLAQRLKEAGYTTAIVGKWHLGHFRPEYLPTRRGFDHQYGHYNGAIDYFTHVRDGGFDWHQDDKVSRDEGYSTQLLGDAAARFIATNAGKRPFFLYVPFNAVHAPHQAPEVYLRRYRNLRRPRRQYAAMLTAMDDAVGKIVEAVEQAGGEITRCLSSAATTAGPVQALSRTTANSEPARPRCTREACGWLPSQRGTDTSVRAVRILSRSTSWTGTRHC